MLETSFRGNVALGGEGFSNITRCGNDSFLHSCHTEFDFSLLFEQSIFSIIPSTILLLVAPLRILHLSQRSHKVRDHPSRWSKLLTSILLSALQLALLVFWTQIPGTSRSKVSVASTVLALIGSLALTFLTYAEHMRSVRPSTVICVYLFFSIAFDAVQCRTLWLMQSLRPYTADLEPLVTVFTTMIAAKIIMFIQEIQGKRKILRAAWRNLSPESTSGILDRAFFWWVNGLMRTGFRGILSVDGLYATDQKLKSKWLLKRVKSSWEKRQRSGTHALLISVIVSVKDIILLAIIPRISLIGFKFAQPFLIHRIVTYVQEGKHTENVNTAYGLVGATALIYAGLAISTGFYQHMVYRFITMIRGSLVSLIYSKILRLEATNGFNGSAALTLANSDTERICSSFESLHEIWANPIEIALAIWLLEKQIGLACISPAVVVLCCTLVTFRLSKFMGPAQGVWMDAVQNRVSMTSSIIGSMKEVKLLGLANTWLRGIQNMRVHELNLSKKFRMLIVYMNVLGNASPMIAPVSTFGLFILTSKLQTGQTLTAATAFTSLSLLGLLMPPLAQLIAAIPSFAGALGCFNRIQTFLLKTNHCGYRVGTLNNNVISSSPSASQIELSILASTSQQLISFSAGEYALSVQNGSFSASAGGPLILQDVTIQILPSTITQVIGRVGTGKSVLLKGLLGEAFRLSGFVKTSVKDIAYCDQQTWLRNSSIEDNIVGQSNFDRSWYNTVVEACSLVKDFAQLPQGDKQLIGSKGVSLSGGQKQRITLARAIYSRKQIVIVDDILSGLDRRTQDEIWGMVFGPRGLFRQHGITVVIATHTLRYLRDADKIVVLGNEGRVINQGQLDELNQRDEYIRTLFAEDELYHFPQDDLASDMRGQREQAKSRAVIQAETDEQKDLLRSTGDSSLYRYYFKSIGSLYSLGIFSLGAIATFCIVFPDVWLRFWVEADSSHTGMYFGIYVILSIVGLFFIGLDIWFMFVKVTPKSAQHLHLTLLKTVMNATLSFFVSTDSGVIINRFSQDMSLIDMSLPTALYTTVSASLHCLASGVLIMVGVKYLAAAIPFALIFVYCLQKFYLCTSRQLRHLDLEAKSPLYTHILETIGGLTTIRAYGWEYSFHDKNLELLDLSQRPFYLLYCIQRWLQLVLDLFVGALAVVLVAMTTLIPGTTNAGAIGVALINILSFNSNLANLISSWTSLETSLGAIARLKSLNEETAAESQPTQPKTLPDGWPSQGHVKLKNVVASYSTNPEPVLRGLSLEIKPGEKIAICGRTGSGKSSLLLAISRLIELNGGTIAIDHIETTELAPNTIRSHIITIPQQPVIFPGSIRFNMTATSLGQPSDEEIISALKKVELWDHISQNGLDEDLSSTALSEGQKQLFCLARAVLRKRESKILVLDEAMSSVDKQTEELMVRVLKEEFAEHTAISVVHKLNTVMGFDRVVVLDAGRIAEIGEPAHFLKGKQGGFNVLHETGRGVLRSNS
ncbi:putative ABC multidrug transporter [Bisporella sp. PMI_857]|nr:putative ABC multidrug transporter [Bisporella sp. PMI_857]